MNISGQKLVDRLQHGLALALAFWRELFVVVAIFPVLGIFYPHLLRMERAHMGYWIIYGLILALFDSLAYFLLGERMSTAQITGSLMILGAVGFLRLYEG